MAYLCRLISCFHHQHAASEAPAASEAQLASTGATRSRNHHHTRGTAPACAAQVAGSAAGAPTCLNTHTAQQAQGTSPRTRSVQGAPVQGGTSLLGSGLNLPNPLSTGSSFGSATYQGHSSPTGQGAPISATGRILAEAAASQLQVTEPEQLIADVTNLSFLGHTVTGAVFRGRAGILGTIADLVCRATRSGPT